MRQSYATCTQNRERYCATRGAIVTASPPMVARNSASPIAALRSTEALLQQADRVRMRLRTAAAGPVAATVSLVAGSASPVSVKRYPEKILYGFTGSANGSDVLFRHNK